jgi:hypothetical protein
MRMQYAHFNLQAPQQRAPRNSSNAFARVAEQADRLPDGFTLNVTRSRHLRRGIGLSTGFAGT